MKPVACVFIVAAGLCGASIALAQSYPVKPIRFINIFAAGSSGDLFVRIFSNGFAESLGQPVVIENIAGAGGVVAAERVARAAPDGYTLLASISGTHVQRLFLAKSTPFHPVNDFTPITSVVESITYLVATSSLPVNSLKELIDYAKANPGKISYGSSGVGSPSHLATELMKVNAGIDLVHVPYKAIAQALQDAIGGQIPLTYAISNQVIAPWKAGKIKILAITNAQRYAPMGDIPTIGEVVPGYEAAPGWTGALAPANLPAPILKRVHADMVRAINAPEAVRKYVEAGAMVNTSPSPEDFAARIRREVEVVGRIVKRAGIQAVD
ncbi:MAG: tripartite tricarboxylate transporter substrate binding protein [Betaproteobacteria bacterium]|nr:tripartite tricarboxylate transporter substrate binding protein [Betaproteobacteria bacterium]